MFGISFQFIHLNGCRMFNTLQDGVNAIPVNHIKEIVVFRDSNGFPLTYITAPVISLAYTYGGKKLEDGYTYITVDELEQKIYKKCFKTILNDYIETKLNIMYSVEISQGYTRVYPLLSGALQIARLIDLEKINVYVTWYDIEKAKTQMILIDKLDTEYLLNQSFNDLIDLHENYIKHSIKGDI